VGLTFFCSDKQIKDEEEEEEEALGEGNRSANIERNTARDFRGTRAQCNGMPSFNL
jgi:hypothetical protein